MNNDEVESEARRRAVQSALDDVVSVECEAASGVILPERAQTYSAPDYSMAGALFLDLIVQAVAYFRS